MKLIRVACSGRVDLAFIHRAFERGADGVFIGGCWPGECHYVTQGNLDALGNVHLYRKLLEHLGLSPQRLRVEWIAASEGTRYAELINDFVATLRGLGPLGLGEGLPPALEPPEPVPSTSGIGGSVGPGPQARSAEDCVSTAGSPPSPFPLAGRLEAAGRLIPYLKLLERERLRPPARTQEAFDRFYQSPETVQLLDQLIGEKLAISGIVSLLRERPLTTAEIALRLSLSPSEVSRHLNTSSRQGLVCYDLEQQRYALA